MDCFADSQTLSRLEFFQLYQSLYKIVKTILKLKKIKSDLWLKQSMLKTIDTHFA